MLFDCYIIIKIIIKSNIIYQSLISYIMILYNFIITDKINMIII